MKIDIYHVINTYNVNSFYKIYRIYTELNVYYLTCFINLMLLSGVMVYTFSPSTKTKKPAYYICEDVLFMFN